MFFFCNCSSFQFSVLGCPFSFTNIYLCYEVNGVDGHFQAQFSYIVTNILICGKCWVDITNWQVITTLHHPTPNLGECLNTFTLLLILLSEVHILNHSATQSRNTIWDTNLQKTVCRLFRKYVFYNFF